MIPITINTSLAINHYNKIQGLLLHHIRRILRDGGITQRPRGRRPIPIRISIELRTLLQSLQDLNTGALRSLICQLPADINTYAQNLIDTHPNFSDTTHSDFVILYNIFVTSVYESDKFNKYDFISPIEISTCPYCNRNYIFYIRTKLKDIKPEIDHFYPKKKYPILALSYFNLIPSCQSCNGFSAKGLYCPIDKNLKNPYLITNNDFLFTFKINNISVINPLIGKSDISISFKKSIPGNSEIFNLNSLYSLHYDHAIELIIKKRLKYPQKYRQYLQSYKGLTFSKSEIDRMILGNYSLEKEQHKRPLSKLYQDIGKELGLIK